MAIAGEAILLAALVLLFWLLLQGVAHATGEGAAGQTAEEGSASPGPPDEGFLIGPHPTPPASGDRSTDAPGAVGPRPATGGPDRHGWPGPGAGEPVVPPGTVGGTRPAGGARYLDLCSELFRDGVELTDGHAGWATAEARRRVEERFRIWINDLALGVAAALGSSDSPRALLRAVSNELIGRRGLEVVPPDASLSWGQLHLPPLLTGRQSATAPAIALVFLAVAETVRPGVRLSYVALPDGAAAVHAGDERWEALLALDPAGSRETTREELRRRHGLDDRRTSGPPRWLRPLSHDEFAGYLRLELARRAARLGLAERANELYARSAALQRSWPDAELALARAAEERGARAAALAHVSSALEIDPNDPDALETRARLRLAAGDRRGARADYRTLLESHPDRTSTVERALGDMARADGRLDEAMEHYRLALRAERDAVGRQEISRDLDRLRLLPAKRAMREGDYSARFAAIRRLADSPDVEAVELLISALDDRNLRFARVAWYALRRIAQIDLPFSRTRWTEWSRNGGLEGLVESGRVMR